MRDLFLDQEQARYKLRLQHLIEKVKKITVFEVLMLYFERDGYEY